MRRLIQRLLTRKHYGKNIRTYLAQGRISQQFCFSLRRAEATHRAGRGTVQIRRRGAAICRVGGGNVRNNPGEVVFKEHSREGYGDSAGYRGVAVRGQGVGSTVYKEKICM